MATKHRARVLIADNHAKFAEKCKGILESEFDVVGLVLDGSDLAKAVAELKPDVLIIDVVMPPLSGFALGEQVKAIRPKVKIIYMTAAPDFDGAAAAFQQGGSAYVDKMDFPEGLVVAVRCALRGDLHLSARAIQAMKSSGHGIQQFKSSRSRVGACSSD